MDWKNCISKLWHLKTGSEASITNAQKNTYMLTLKSMFTGLTEETKQTIYLMT